MSYTPELFNRYNEPLEHNRNMISRSIMGLLKPSDGYPKTDDNRVKELYAIWQADCRAMDAALNVTWHQKSKTPMIYMPPDDDEHKPCRRMFAVLIERTIYDEHIAGPHLAPAIADILASPHCTSHFYLCPCHHLDGWTYNDNTEAAQELGKHFYNSKPTHNSSECACCDCYMKQKAEGTS